jgi:hypothetical protein
MYAPMISRPVQAVQRWNRASPSPSTTSNGALGFLSRRPRSVVASDLFDEKTDAAGAIVIFKLEGGLIVTVYPRSELALGRGSTRRPAAEQRVQPRLIRRDRADVDRIFE